jgi:hypothetical protein
MSQYDCIAPRIQGEILEANCRCCLCFCCELLKCYEDEDIAMKKREMVEPRIHDWTGSFS